MGDDPSIPRTWRDKKDYFALILVFLLLPIVSQAGGLGVALIVSVGGALTLIGLGPSKIFLIVKNTPVAAWAVMALILWGLISTIWSPYQSSKIIPNPVILLLGIPLYFLFARAVALQNRFDTNLIQLALVGGTLISAITIFIDLAFGYPISLAVDPVSQGESFESRRGDLIQNLGHGVSVLALIFPVIAVMLWQKSGSGKLIAILLGSLIFVCTILASVSASMLALVGSIFMMLLAVRRPGQTLKLVSVLAALSLILAPVFAYLALQLSPDQLAALPFSWEERVHNWRYMVGRVLEHPLIGHGFDAVRTFEDAHTVRGFENRAIVSLHPHNAGLHIWSELGAIGITIACTAITLGYLKVQGAKYLGKARSIAICGVLISATINSSFTYGVWQDWWWASIILAGASVFIIRNPEAI